MGSFGVLVTTSIAFGSLLVACLWPAWHPGGNSSLQCQGANCQRTSEPFSSPSAFSLECEAEAWSGLSEDNRTVSCGPPVAKVRVWGNAPLDSRGSGHYLQVTVQQINEGKSWLQAWARLQWLHEPAGTVSLGLSKGPCGPHCDASGTCPGGKNQIWAVDFGGTSSYQGSDGTTERSYWFPRRLQPGDVVGVLLMHGAVYASINGEVVHRAAGQATQLANLDAPVHTFLELSGNVSVTLTPDAPPPKAPLLFVPTPWETTLQAAAFYISLAASADMAVLLLLALCALHAMRRSTKDAKPRVRTAKDEVVPAAQALEALKEGNRRFVAGASLGPMACTSQERALEALATLGQSPMAAVIGCADSRCPVEILFDAVPGDIFVCRNAGNTCTHAEGSMVGSLEFCVGHLRTKLVVVLGHSNCGAIKGATATYVASKQEDSAAAGGRKSALEGLLQDLRHVAQRAESELPAGASADEIATHAVKVNVFSTMEFLLTYSKSIREKVRAGEIEVHGAVYHIETGKVEFLGQSPVQAKLLESENVVPPSMALSDNAH